MGGGLCCVAALRSASSPFDAFCALNAQQLIPLGSKAACSSSARGSAHVPVPVQVLQLCWVWLEPPRGCFLSLHLSRKCGCSRAAVRASQTAERVCARSARSFFLPDGESGLCLSSLRGFGHAGSALCSTQ